MSRCRTGSRHSIRPMASSLRSSSISRIVWLRRPPLRRPCMLAAPQLACGLNERLGFPWPVYSDSTQPASPHIRLAAHPPRLNLTALHCAAPLDSRHVQTLVRSLFCVDEELVMASWRRLVDEHTQLARTYWHARPGACQEAQPGGQVDLVNRCAPWWRPPCARLV